MAQWLTIRLGTMRLWVRSLALLNGLRIQRCRELWCRSQTQLGSGVAVALARPVATALIRPLAWEPPYAAGAAQRNSKKKKKQLCKEVECENIVSLHS